MEFTGDDGEVAELGRFEMDACLLKRGEFGRGEKVIGVV